MARDDRGPLPARRHAARDALRPVDAPAAGGEGNAGGADPRTERTRGGGELDNVSVTVTGDRLCLCETCTGTDAGSSLLDRVRELDGWGREFDASVSRFFETRELDSSVAGETARALVPPRVAVALYCDGTLAGAFPCEMGDATVATRDFVAALNRFCEDASPSSDGKESLRVDSAPNSHS
ncbi:HTH domain-containing protein [Halosimplex aquaticum]